MSEQNSLQIAGYNALTSVNFVLTRYQLTVGTDDIGGFSFFDAAGNVINCVMNIGLDGIGKITDIGTGALVGIISGATMALAEGYSVVATSTGEALSGVVASVGDAAGNIVEKGGFDLTKLAILGVGAFVLYKFFTNSSKSRNSTREKEGVQ